MREKLIKILETVVSPKEVLCDGEVLVSTARVADHLIANGVTIQKWIPVTERLPEEHDSIFTSFYGTEKWQDGMFLKVSDTVLASVEYEDGKRDAVKKGCEYCSGEFAEYQHTVNTKLNINTFGKARTLVTECTPCPPYAKCGLRGIPARSAFIINFCPNCGKDLRGEEDA